MADSDLYQDVRIKHLRSEGWNLVPVSGATGGITGSGQIHISLYQDVPSFPEATILNQRTNRESPEQEEEFVSLERRIHFTAVMQPEIAELVGKLLLSAVKRRASLEKSEVPPDITEN